MEQNFKKSDFDNLADILKNEILKISDKIDDVQNSISEITKKNSNGISIITENVIPQKDEKLEMLTVKECAELVKGLSEHTVRQLAKQNKIPYVRAGQGKNGKILIAKSALMSYLNGSQ